MVNKINQDVVPDLMVWQSEWIARRVNGQQYCGTGHRQRTLEHKCSGRTKKGHPVRLMGHGSKANFLKGKGVTNTVRRQG